MSGMTSAQARPAGRPRCDATHRAVLRAAYELLAEGGLRQFTIEGVAARSGVARTTIYRWWPSKGALAMEGFLAATAAEISFPFTRSAIADLKAHLQRCAKLLRGAPGRIMAGIVAEGQSDPETLAAFTEHYLRAAPARGPGTPAARCGQRRVAAGPRHRRRPVRALRPAPPAPPAARAGGRRLDRPACRFGFAGLRRAGTAPLNRTRARPYGCSQRLSSVQVPSWAAGTFGDAARRHGVVLSHQGPWLTLQRQPSFRLDLRLPTPSAPRRFGMAAGYCARSWTAGRRRFPRRRFLTSARLARPDRCAPASATYKSMVPATYEHDIGRQHLLLCLFWRRGPEVRRPDRNGAENRRVRPGAASRRPRLALRPLLRIARRPLSTRSVSNSTGTRRRARRLRRSSFRAACYLKRLWRIRMPKGLFWRSLTARSRHGQRMRMNPIWTAHPGAC